MTATTNIVGMIPIAAEQAIGLERLSPLAIMAIGGLIVGTFLTLIYVPILYILQEKLVARFRKPQHAERPDGLSDRGTRWGRRRSWRSLMMM